MNFSIYYIVLKQLVDRNRLQAVNILLRYLGFDQIDQLLRNIEFGHFGIVLQVFLWKQWLRDNLVNFFIYLFDVWVYCIEIALIRWVMGKLDGARLLLVLWQT